MLEAIDTKTVKWTKSQRPKFRLPNSLEWVYAARGGDSSWVFPWGIESKGVQNARGCCYCNFNYSISKDQLRTENVECKPSQKGPKYPILTSVGYMVDTFVTCPVFSYNPNLKGMYCFLGNAAEMVYTWQAEPTNAALEARSMGGAWIDPVSNMRIEGPEQYRGITTGKAFIGFRPVMVLN
jgi:formylglycine-generating enzyme required for sulfatase activity